MALVTLFQFERTISHELGSEPLFDFRRKLDRIKKAPPFDEAFVVPLGINIYFKALYLQRIAEFYFFRLPNRLH